MRGPRPSRILAALGLVAVAAFVCRALLPGDLPASGDIASVFWPDVLAYERALGAGRLPLWDPLLRCGHPHLAIAQSQVLYPPKLLHLVLPSVPAFVLLHLLHLVALAAGTYHLARALGRSRGAAGVAALAAQLSPMVASATSSLNLFYALCAAPWPVLFAVRAGRRGRLRDAVACGATLALVFLAGSPELALCAGLAVGLAFVSATGRAGPRALVAGGIAALTFVALAAAQLLPFLQLAGLSSRATGLAEGEAYLWSLRGADLLRVVLPLAYDDAARPPSAEEFWAGQTLLRSTYAGATVAVLALLSALGRGRTRLLVAGLALVLLLVALGPATPLFPLLRELPGLSSVRYPVKFAAAALLALPLLAAAGVDALASRGRRGIPPPTSRAALETALLVTGAVGLLLAAFAAGAGALLSVSLAWAAAALGAVGLCVRHLRGPRSFLLPGLATLLVAADLGASQLARPLLAGEDPAPFVTESAVARAIRPRLGAGRVMSWYGQDDYFRAADRAAFWRDAKELGVPNRLSEDGIPTVGGSRPPELDGLTRLLDTPGPGVLRLLAARVHLAPGPVRGLVTVPSPRPDVHLSEDPAVRGRAFVVPAFEVLGREELFARAARPDFDPYRAVLLEADPQRDRDPDRDPDPDRDRDPERDPDRDRERDPDPDRPQHAARDQGAGGALPDRSTATFVRDDPEAIDLDVDAPAGGFLVVADSWDPGWKATVGGEPAPVLRAYGYVRTLRLPPGRHRVELRYEPWTVRVGLWVSGVALLAACAALALGGRRRAGERSSVRGTRPVV